MNERPGPGAAQLQSHLAALTNTSKTPGVQYLVVDATGTLFEYAGGWADFRQSLPLDARTTLMAYSMSKTITAVAVLQLVESGEIVLDDPADRYVNSLPYGPGVTIRQLLAHTSGIPNPIPLRWVHPAAEHAGFDEDAALASVLRDNPRLSSDPGGRYAYSNIGYWLLGKVVERASGQAFPAYVDGHVLRPLAIPPEDLGYVVMDPDHHATGYLERYSWMNLAKGFLIDRALVGNYAGRWLEIHSHYPNGPAFGGLVGNARGFGRFLQDQLAPRSALFSDTTRRLMHTPQVTKEGAEVAMTLGWHVGHLGQTRMFYKEGGGGGFHCMMRVYPAAGIGTVVMTNATGFDVRRLMDEVDVSFLASR